MAREDNSLDQVDPTGLGEREGTKREIGERKEWDFRERSSTFSLEFLEIGPSVSDEAEEKLLPTARAMRGYWFWGVSTNFEKVWVFFYLI